MQLKLFPLFFLLLILFLIGGCRLNTGEPETKQFLIVDRSSNKVVNSYEYGDSNQLTRVDLFNNSQRVSKRVDYEYDKKGYIQSKTETRTGNRIKETRYSTQEFFDNQGRLIKVVRQSPSDKTVEVFYGYDDSGNLRGVVQREEDGSLMMMDYKE